MNRKHILIKFLIIVFIFIINISSNIFAHPLDVTITLIYLDENNPEKAKAEMIWHPFEINHLLAKHGIRGETWKDYKEQEDLFYKYIRNNFSFKNEGEECEFIAVGMPEIDTASMYSDGVVFLFYLKSDKPIDKVKVKNTLFVNDFRLQTNKHVFLSDRIDPNDVKEHILTAKVTEFEQWIFSEKTQAMIEEDKKRHIDTDGDMIADYLEPRYGTDPDNPDTDGDGFTDGDEILNGWDPTNKDPSPGQPVKEEDEMEAYTNDEIESIDDISEDINNNDEMFEIIEDNTTDEYKHNADKENTEYNTFTNVNEKSNAEVNGNNNNTSIDNTNKDIDSNNEIDIVSSLSDNSDNISDVEDTGKEVKYSTDDPDIIHKEIHENKVDTRKWDKKALDFGFSFAESFIKNNNPMALIIIILVALFFGFVHTFTTGHGKTIMISYVLNKSAKFINISAFILIIAFSHVVMMTALGMLSLLALEWIGDTYNILNIMPFVGACIFLIISLFAIKEGMHELKGIKESIPDKSKYGFLLTALLIGLAPCPFSLGIVYWSVSMVSEYGYNIAFMIMVMFAFSIGIILALSVIAFVVMKTKRAFTGKFSSFKKYLPLITGVIMLIIAIIYLINNFPL